MLKRRTTKGAARLSYLKNACSGGISVETACSVGVFLFLIFSFITLSLHLYRKVGLQYAVNDATRWASIGLVSLDPAKKRVVSSPLPRKVSELQDYVKTRAETFGVQVVPTNVSVSLVCGVGEPPATCNPNIVLAQNTDLPSNRMFRVVASGTGATLAGIYPLSLQAIAVGLSEP